MTSILLLVLACGVPVIEPGAVVAPARGTDAAPSRARLVDCAGGGDHSSISSAVAAAADGEEILIAPCTYDEDIDFEGKRLVLRGDGDREDIVIGSGGNSSAVTANHGEPEGTAIVGVTLQGGRASYGSAVAVTLSSLRLEDVTITGGSGAISVYASGADLELSQVDIEDASASTAVIYGSRGTIVGDEVRVICDRGYGIYSGHGAIWMDGLEIECGRQSAFGSENSTGALLRAVIEGGMSMVQEDDHYDDTIRLENAIVEGNISQTYGNFQFRNSIIMGGISLTTVDASTSIRGSVIMGASCGLSSDTTGYTVSHTVFWDNTQDSCDGVTYVGRDGNLGVDPRFTDADAGDFTLAGSSPLIDAGPNEEGWDDADGSRNDIGAYGGPHALGGGI